MQRMTKLTTQDWEIYKVLKHNSREGKWTPSDYLAQRFNICNREVRRVIQKLKTDDKIQKIIISDYGKGYKLLSSKEEFVYLEKKKIEILSQFKRYYRDVKRYNLNNQKKITFGKYERDFVESIL